MIIDLQRRLAEVGRIRIGQQVKSGKGSRPAKLDTFRLTSPDRTRIDHAAQLYGGVPAQWEAPSGPQWEVITQTDALPVVVPPSDMAFTQAYELWSGGGCKRRCDTVTEHLSDGPCLCDPEARDCKIHSRLSVMLRDLPGLGVWRIDSTGFYAAGEILGAMDIVKMAAGRGQMLPATLRLEQRQIKRADETVKKFAVPVLDLMVSPAQLLGQGDRLDAGTLSIEPPRIGAATIEAAEAMMERQYVTPVPKSVPERPTESVAEQATKTRQRKPRKNAAAKIPPTGVKPRTAAEATKSGRGGTYDSHFSDDPWPPHDPEDTSGGDYVDPGDGTHEPDPRTRLNRKMHALFRDAGIDKDRRDDRLTITRYIAKRFDIDTSNGLKLDELEYVVDILDAWQKNGALTDQINDLLNQAAVDLWQQQEQNMQQLPDEAQQEDEPQ